MRKMHYEEHWCDVVGNPAGGVSSGIAGSPSRGRMGRRKNSRNPLRPARQLIRSGSGTGVVVRQTARSSRT